ncbi:hypothetical protein [uncultured Friedmanniella sp.]|uniref:hypothetical protein n=1 Tax=uncultured Friedmanniella sp. TaxID=335381 RepID=UPI0035C98A6D
MDSATDPSATPSRDLTLDLGRCAETAGHDQLTAALLGCPGVTRAHVDPYVTWALATFDPDRTDPEQIVQQLAAAGLEVRIARLFEPDEREA